MLNIYIYIFGALTTAFPFSGAPRSWRDTGQNPKIWDKKADSTPKPHPKHDAKPTLNDAEFVCKRTGPCQMLRVWDVVITFW